MLRQLVVVIGVLVNGSAVSYLTLNTLPGDMGIVAGILVFGAVLLLLGIYVANNDRQRRLRNNFYVPRRMERQRRSRSGRQARAA